MICSGVYRFRLIPTSLSQVQNKPDPLNQPGPPFPWQASSGVADRTGQHPVGPAQRPAFPEERAGGGARAAGGFGLVLMQENQMLSEPLAAYL